MLFRAAETPQFEEIKIASPLFMQIAGSLPQLHKRDSPLAIMNRPQPRTSPPKFVTYLLIPRFQETDIRRLGPHLQARFGKLMP